MTSTQLTLLPSGEVVEARSLNLTTSLFSQTGSVEMSPVSTSPKDKPVGTQLVADLINPDKVATITEKERMQPYN